MFPMSKKAVTRYSFDRFGHEITSGAVTPGGYWEERDEDGNLVSSGIADAYKRPPERDMGKKGGSVYADRNLGESRSSPNATPAQETRKGRLIRESAERRAARRAARQDKLDKANTFYEVEDYRVGIRPPSAEMSDKDLDDYIRRTEKMHAPSTREQIDARTRDYNKQEARAEKKKKDDEWIEQQNAKRMESLRAGATKVPDKTKSFAEKQKESVESVKKELYPGEDITTRLTTDPLVTTDPRIKSVARPVAKFDYGDGKKVALKDSRNEKYRGKDGIVRDTPEDKTADWLAKRRREDAMRPDSPIRKQVLMERATREGEFQARIDRAAEAVDLHLRKNRRRQMMPGYNPSRAELEFNKAAREQRKLDPYGRGQ
jgi:hypothetical protein